jgi:hypothetical protein
MQDNPGDGGGLSDSVGTMDTNVSDTNVSDGVDLESPSSSGGGGAEREEGIDPLVQQA